MHKPFKPIFNYLEMKKEVKLSLYLVIGIIALVLAFFVIRNITHQGDGITRQAPRVTNFTLIGTKFADSPISKSAYLISADSLSPDAEKAIAGFSLNKTTLADGSMNITLKALNPEYQDQNYLVQPGQQLYFIELNFGDDSAPQGEYNMRDDKTILVDSNGIILA